MKNTAKQGSEDAKANTKALQGGGGVIIIKTTYRAMQRTI